MSWFWGKSKKDEQHDDDSSSYESEEYSDDDEEEYSDEEEGSHGSEDDDEPHHHNNNNNNHHDDKVKDHSSMTNDDKEQEEQQRDPSPAAEKTNEKDNDEATEEEDESSSSNVDDEDKDDTKVAVVAVAAAAAAAGEETTEAAEARNPAIVVETPTKNPSADPAGDVLATTKRSNKRVQKDSEEDDDEVTDEDVLVGHIPQQVTSNRPRFPSALSVDGQDGDASSSDSENDQDDENNNNNANKNAVPSENDDDFETVNVDDDINEEEEEEVVTSMAEKQSLLALAAEHDRVDILQSLLNESSSSSSKEDGAQQQEEHRQALLHGGLPPLHMAIKHGSINATNCLLRMGADPSIRPDVQALSSSETSAAATPAVPKDLHGVSAWELAFGGRPVTMPPSKREGIRHAFTAEALRCIGSDEVERLQQLLDAGMPADIEMGGKTLYYWAVEMQGVQCQKALRPEQPGDENKETSDHENTNEPNTSNDNNKAKPTRSAVLDRPSGKETFSQLVNRFDELENLARALSTCLDNLAEEVSVCHGLLLMGGGATALASHVRSLKALKERKHEELTRLQESWENSQDELAYWVREYGCPEGEQIAAQITPADMHLLVRRQSLLQPKRDKEDEQALSPEEEEAARLRQLQAQIAASESKVRKLRVSIADLSEENARDLKEVEKRGLAGGIHLVRGLRDEIREVEFAITEFKSEEAGCRAKIHEIQTKVQQKQQKQSKHSDKATPSSRQPEATVALNGTRAPSAALDDRALVNGSGGTRETGDDSKIDQITMEHSDENNKHRDTTTSVQSNGTAAVGVDPPESSPTMTHSERMATGQSTAIALRTDVSGGRGGYFTVGLWQIILRIIGLQSTRTTAMVGGVASTTSSRPSGPPRSGNRSTLSRSSSTATAHSSAQPAMIL